MAVVEFELDDDTANRISRFFKSGRKGRLTLLFESRRVLDVECTEIWTNGMGVRRYLPGATGVNLAEKA